MAGARRMARCGLAALALHSAGDGLAQASAADSSATEDLHIETVVVTATKRATDLQEVPSSVATLNEEQLQLIGSAGDDIQFLSARLPSLTLESSFGRIFPRAYIRGLGNTDFDLNASQPVSFIYDDVVFENPALKGFPIFDVAQVELLRGPQGTLFGRNTPAGILKFNSVQPSQDVDAYLTTSFGRFDALQVEGAAGGGLSDSVSVRVSGLYQRRDDFIRNQVLGEAGDAGGFDEFAWRAQLAFEPSDAFSLLLNLHGRHLAGGQTSFQANAFAVGTREPRPGFDRQVSFADAAADSVLDLDSRGLTLKARYALGGVELTYVGGVETLDLFSRGDVDGGFGAAFIGLENSGPLAVNGDGAVFTSDAFPDGFVPPFPAETADAIDGLRQVSHELRLANDGAERLRWTVGFYAFDEELDIDSFNFDTLAGGAPNGEAFQTQETDSRAVFAALAYDLTQKITVAGGARYTDDAKDFSAVRPIAPFVGEAGALEPIAVQVGDEDLSWDVSLTYAWTDDVSTFARVATGFRSPSIQGRLLFGDVVTTADSEELISYEAGVRSVLFDDRVRANVTGYYYEIDGQQLTAIGGAGNFNQLLNADRGVGYGVEAELDVILSQGLTFTGGFSFNATEIQDQDLTVGICGSPCTVLDPIDPVTGGALIDGNPFPQAPEWIVNGILSYARPLGGGEAFAVTDWAYRSDANVFLYESVEFTADSYAEGGVRAGWRRGPWEFAAFGRNITDAVGTVSAIDFNNFSGIFNQPSTWGLEVIWRR
ncbi:MAG: TonB-dependent receptor [Pseudomonadota bacterium]